MASNYNQLVAYQVSVAIATELHSAVVAWPEFDKNTVGTQLIRAIDSVGANIAEAMGRWTTADRRRLLMIARGSLYETEHWINTATRRGLLKTDFSDQLARAGRTLNGLLRRTF